MEIYIKMKISQALKKGQKVRKVAVMRTFLRSSENPSLCGGRFAPRHHFGELRSLWRGFATSKGTEFPRSSGASQLRGILPGFAWAPPSLLKCFAFCGVQASFFGLHSLIGVIYVINWQNIPENKFSSLIHQLIMHFIRIFRFV